MDEDESQEERPRPLAFRGIKTQREFLQQYWGDRYPELVAWAEKTEHVDITDSVWDMDERLLPDEAREKIEAAIRDMIIGERGQGHREHASKAACRFPLDRALRDWTGGPLAVGGP